MDIAEFQKLMKDLYFHNDSKRGLYRTSIWMIEEIGELMRELKKTQNDMDFVNIGEEMADIYAWIASIANLLNINLDDAVSRKYPNKCIKCDNNPCRCKKYV